MTARKDVEAKFDACFRAHYAEVLAYALRRLGERGAAEDVAAQTFAVAWRRLDALPADPLPWLLGVARHVIQNEARSARRRSRLLARITGQHRALAAPADPADSVPERSAILAAFGHLSEGDREVLRLGAWEGLDARRAAAALDCTRGAYALRLHRARRRLAKELAASGHVGDEDEPALLTEMAREETG
ncbi:MAG TPA: sigma-70 family RNA polymerase sigma factor [Gaiellaceae bacterium]|nr:sigma-70 family RNA polymerase sigma factor [Gaiellaceae bacterium]